MNNQPDAAEPKQRTNQKGHPCPPWCTVDHHTPIRGADDSPVYVDVHHIVIGSVKLNDLAHAVIEVYQPAGVSDPEIRVYLFHDGTRKLLFSARVAAVVGHLGLLEATTGMQLEQITAEIRKAVDLTVSEHEGRS